MEAIKDEATGRWRLNGVHPESQTYATICENLRMNIPFKFARYGDGEINCMNGKIGKNCDGHEYYPALGIKLLQSIEQEPPYMVGIQPLSVHHLRGAVNAYFKGFTLHNADVLHNASIDGHLSLFTNALQGRYIILVGPAHLAALFDECVHIVVTPVNCWKQYDQVKSDLQLHMDGIDNPVVLLCCGMMAEVLIYELRKTVSTIIDCGSVFDPYCGVKSRSYHNKLSLQ